MQQTPSNMTIRQSMPSIKGKSPIPPKWTMMNKTHTMFRGPDTKTQQLWEQKTNSHHQQQHWNITASVRNKNKWEETVTQIQKMAPKHKPLPDLQGLFNWRIQHYAGRIHNILKGSFLYNIKMIKNMFNAKLRPRKHASTIRQFIGIYHERFSLLQTAPKEQAIRSQPSTSTCSDVNIITKECTFTLSTAM